MVPPDPSRAASCAAASTARAKPETIVTPACESSRASRAATSRPYRVALREPTTATAGRVNLSSRPTAKSRNGGSAISASRTGYSGSNAVTIRRPQASTDAAHRSAAASSGPARTARAPPTEPRRSESSPCGVESRASRPPRSRRAGHNLWGVSSRDRAQEIAVRRAKCIRYIFSPTPDGRRARRLHVFLRKDGKSGSDRRTRSKFPRARIAFPVIAAPHRGIEDARLKKAALILGAALLAAGCSSYARTEKAKTEISFG